MVILNGASSAGKTSIAEYMTTASTKPYLNIEGDMFYRLLAPRYVHVSDSVVEKDPGNVQGFSYVKTDKDEEKYLHTGPVIHRLYDGMLESLHALVKTGNNVIFNFGLTQDILARMVNRYKNIKVYLIGIHTPIEVLEQREAKRGDRPAGLARMQLAEAHAHDTYDFTVDTAQLTVSEAAEQIMAFVESGATPKAFDTLRKKSKR